MYTEIKNPTGTKFARWQSGTGFAPGRNRIDYYLYQNDNSQAESRIKVITLTD